MVIHHIPLPVLLLGVDLKLLQPVPVADGAGHLSSVLGQKVPLVRLKSVDGLLATWRPELVAVI